MATYKVLQDIEAEDKLVGPLSLRQFVYAGVAAVCLYICFLAYTRGASFLIAIFLPIAVIGTFFAFPWKGEQPTEIWALARLRFMVKPRVRIWNQDGAKDLVTVNAPRKAPTRPKQRDLTQYEVRSRLRALADTIDSRGWATRNANYQFYMNQHRQHSDRLVNTADLNPSAIPMDAFLPANDMLDDQNPIAQNLDSLLSQSATQKRERVMQQMAQAQMPSTPALSSAAMPASPPPPPSYAPQLPAPAMPANQAVLSYGAMPAADPSGYWFANGPGFPGSQPPVAAPAAQTYIPPMPPPVDPAATQAAMPTEAEQAFMRQMAEQNQAAMQINYGHMRVLQPNDNGTGNGFGNLPGSDGVAQAQAAVDAAMGGAQPVTPAAATTDDAVTRQTDPAILELANNDDLDVATLARQANREIQKSPDEVEIRLH